MSAPGRSDVTWLLELDLGAGTHRYAVEDTSAPSRIAGGTTTLYKGGLTIGDASPDSDSVSCSVRIEGLAALVLQLLTLTGRRAVLRAYRGESYVEDATALVGAIGSVEWGTPGDEERLSMTIERPSDEAGDALCDPGDVIASETMGTWDYDLDREGEVMPVVIGCPGRIAQEGGTRAAPVVPAIVVDGLVGHKRILVAAHRVAAATVDIHNLTDPALTTTGVTIIHEADNTGRTRALVDNAANVYGFAGDVLWTGWQAAYGGGLMSRGRVIDGVGDLLLYGCDTYGRGAYDLPRIETERERLNAYKIDCVWNELAATWPEWLQSMVLEPFGIERVNGPNGTWFRRVPWVARAAFARVHLTTSADDVTGQLGHLVVSPDGGVGETSEEVANRITIAYSPAELSEQIFRCQTIVAPYAEERGDVIGWRFQTHPLATRSAAVQLARRRLLPGSGGGASVDGVVSRTFTLSQVHDPPTALLLAYDRLHRHALPHLLATYTGGRELLDFPGYTEVLLTDAPRGLAGRPALLLPGAVVAGRKVTIRVRIPPL